VAVVHDLTTSREPVASLHTYHRNPRHGDVLSIRRSLAVNGQYRPVVANRGTHTGRPREVLAGNHTLIAARDEGWPDLAVCWVDVDDDQAARIVLADNRTADLGSYDREVLAELLDGLDGVEGTGYTDADLAALLQPPAGGDAAGRAEVARRSLAERFGVPPLTVLDSRQGYWRDRKRQWLDLGLRSDEGRGAELLGNMTSAAKAKARYEGTDPAAAPWAALGTSVFDPVLAELLVRWYSAPGHHVLDPFAGGAVRGIVAALLGRHYTGIDLRPEQVAANEEQAAALLFDPDSPAAWAEGPQGAPVPAPVWLVGDARAARELVAADTTADLMLTCPPYHDLEQYGDDPADLSRCATYATFLAAYHECLAAATDRMAPNAFAAIVTGAVRDKAGYVLDLPADTTRIMSGLGWRLYQDAILITAYGTAGLRAAQPFRASRKLARVHQAVAVYHRGELAAVRDWPDCEAGDLVAVAAEDDDSTALPGAAEAGTG
jgi:hypothetical protein